MKNISFSTYLSKIVILTVLFAILPIALSLLSLHGTPESYVASVACFFIMTVVSAKLILGEKKYVRFYACVFIIEVLIGLLHYLYFVDPNYFNTDGDASSKFWHEYLSVYHAIDHLNEYRDSFDVFYWMDAYELEISHPEIWHFISYPFYFLGHKWMNYSALNVYGTLLTSMNIIFLFKRFYASNEKAERRIKYCTAFFPQFLLCGTVWRDPFGVSLISIGIVLATLSKNTLERILSTALFCTFAFIQRTTYALLAFASSLYDYISRKKSILFKMVIVVVGVFGLYYLSAIVNDANSEDYNSGYINQYSFLALPIKIIFGMIGPFPWVNFLDNVKQNPAFAYQLADYLTGTFQLGYLICIICMWKSISFKKLDVMTVMGFGIMLSGFMTRQLHIGYISEGVIFTLPWFFSQVGKDYKKYFFYSFMILAFLNCVALLLGNFGISALWH